MCNTIIIPQAYVVTAPEIRETGNGNRVAHFVVGEKDVFKDGNGNRVERKTTHRAVAWGKLAEMAQKFFVPGKQFTFHGTLTYNRFERDGIKYSLPELKMNNFQFLDIPAPANNGQKKAEGPAASEAPVPPVNGQQELFPAGTPEAEDFPF